MEKQLKIGKINHFGEVILSDEELKAVYADMNMLEDDDIQKIKNDVKRELDYIRLLPSQAKEEAIPKLLDEPLRIEKSRYRDMVNGGSRAKSVYYATKNNKRYADAYMYHYNCELTKALEAITDNTRPGATKKKPGPSFRSIIQYEDPDKLVQRLHQLIDGKSGVAVGSVFLKAKMDKYIRKTPSQKEFESEFDLIGSWSAIKSAMNTNTPNAEGNARNICIF